MYHRVHTEWQSPISGVHSIMMEKSAPWLLRSGSARPTPFTLFTITYKVACSACTLQLRRKIHYPYFISTARQYVLCGLYTKAASFKLFLEGQAFLRSYDLAPPPPPPPLPSRSSTSAKHRKTEKERHMIQSQESLGLYKSFHSSLQNSITCPIFI